eukprot:gene8628-10619_t
MHLKIYKIYCQKQSNQQQQQTNFISPNTANLFQNDVIQTTAVIPSQINNINPLALLQSTSSSPSTTTTTTTNKPSINIPQLRKHSHSLPVVNNNNNNSNNNSLDNNNNDFEESNKNEIYDEEMSKKNQKILNEPWTSEDQRRLEDALIKYPESRFSSVSRWQSIAKEIGKTPKTVSLRYNQMVNNSIPKLPKSTTADTELDSSSSTSTTSTGKRKSMTPTTTTSGSLKNSKESKSKKEKTSNELEASSPPKSTSSTSPKSLENVKNFNLSEADNLIKRNQWILEQVRTSVMNNTQPNVNILTEFKENIEKALNCTMVWSQNSVNEMPPLPIKVNDMIIGLMSNTGSSLKKPLPKNAAEWNLVIPDEK